jgi:exopolysaccharide biosynthesis WecB/TagA/CpsF family protein
VTPPLVRLLGLDFADFRQEEALRWVLERPSTASFDYVVTPNADHFVRLRRDPALTRMYQQAALRLLDSRVVARAARTLGLPVPPVVTGSDLTARLLAALPAGERLTIVGLRAALLPDLIERTGIASPAHFDPPMGFERDPAAFATVVRFVLEHPARFILLAVGSPRQERLAAAIKARGVATGLGLCVGASLDFLTGTVPRAPRWMQSAGFEWLHRLAGDPRRLARRYLLQDPAIFWMLLRARASADGTIRLR